MTVSIDAATTLDRSVSKGQNRRIALWSSIVIVLTLTTIAVVALDAPLTPEQRIALYSGTFP
jgi:predicted nuclease with RNAse H fold